MRSAEEEAISSSILACSAAFGLDRPEPAVCKNERRSEAFGFSRGWLPKSAACRVASVSHLPSHGAACAGLIFSAPLFVSVGEAFTWRSPSFFFLLQRSPSWTSNQRPTPFGRREKRAHTSVARQQQQVQVASPSVSAFCSFELSHGEARRRGFGTDQRGRGAMAGCRIFGPSPCGPACYGQ